MPRPRRSAPALLCLALAGCASAATSPAPAPDALMVPGISRELARQRAATLSDVRYDLALDLTGTDSVPGMATLTFRRRGGGDLVVDYRGVALHEVRANGREVADPLWRDGHVLVPARYLLRGENRLDFRFVSAMAPAGASIIRFQEPEHDGRPGDTYLYSLLVPADANQLFPSFDQPDLKGVFRLEATAPAGWTVLSNSAPADRLRRPGRDVEWWSFAPTRPISTYLFAVAAGPWRVWTDSVAGGRTISLHARRSRADEVDADSLIAIDRAALEWLERYFASPYPFDHFGLLLAPAFPFGGMEHPGAIYYNESRFVFREPPTLPERLARSATIYHEVAHQWFGDLVTMRWFDDLWLKEGFATYMAARMQAELNPGTGAWKTFYLRNKPPAYAVDVTRGTTPVWQALPNLDLAKSNYGPIVYNKAPAILKQLEFWVGEPAFRTGLQHLLRDHAYGSITWRDLLAALERSSGQRLDAFGEAYVLRAGAPIVETRLETEGGRVKRLRLVQRPAVRLEGDSAGAWPGRLRVRLGYADAHDVVLPVTLAGDTTVVDSAAGLPAPDYVFPNDGDYGYGVFLLDPASADYLAAHVGELGDDLLRALAWGALWDLVREGRLPAERFLDTAAREIPRERDEQIAAFLLRRATLALALYLPEERAAPLRERFEHTLLERVEDERLPYDLRKAALDSFLGVARTPAALRVARELLEGSRSFAGAPLREPSRWSAIEQLLATGAPGADSIFRAERARATGPEAGRRAFVTGAAAPSAAVKAEYFRRYLDDPDLNEEWVTASLAAFNRPDQEALTLPFLRPALERLPWIQRNRRIFFLPQWINAFVLGQRSPAALRVVDDYLAAHPDLAPDLRRKVYEARDELERTVRIRGGGVGVTR